ncbi:hypothetical protein VM98_32560 [Streptomyces rubellomurinus subsp. indigoferus]|nr:hypothetical protein VM98_32560 [Streptomyces rubellomurinus subsp. indigoferus]
MDIADHKKTGSWGTAGKGWRADQTRLLVQGKFKEAIAKDVQDAQAIAPGKYTKAIAEMKSKLPKEWKQLGADK